MTMKSVFSARPSLKSSEYANQIINNYMGAGNDSKPPFASADNAFKLYNADANYDPAEPDQHYYHFRYADTAFFVLDTRRYRSDVTEHDDSTQPTMLGDKQLSALYDWLGRVSLQLSLCSRY